MAGAGAKPFVDAKICQRKVILFAKRSCPESKRIRGFMSLYNYKPQMFEVVEIERRQDCAQIENYFQTICLTDSRTVPHLFIDEKYIGDEKIITRYEESGKLKELLEEADAITA